MMRTTLAALALTGLVLSGCGDDGSTRSTGVETSTTIRQQDRDHDPDQDRDRIHQLIQDTLDACEDQDRDRLRDVTRDHLHEDLDHVGFITGDDITLEVTDVTVALDGDRATAQAHLRVYDRDRLRVETQTEWQFHHDGTAWLLDELPPCLDSTGTDTPVVTHEPERDQDRDHVDDD